MTSSSISVIVPHYNRPDLVGRAVESIRKQSLQPLEILLVDDCSSHENKSRLAEFASLATIVSTPVNMGPTAARNFGVQQAKGEWIAFLDDDDEYLPEKLKMQQTYLQNNPKVQALGGGLLMVAPDGRQEYWGGKPTRKLFLADALLYTASMPQALMIRRDLFLKMGGFDVSLRSMEDYELGIRLLSAGVEMHSLGEPLFFYYFGGGREQLTKNWYQMFSSELTVIRMHSREARQTFGRFGAIQLTAACCMKWGIRRGRLVGRGTWFLGAVLERLFGKVQAGYTSTVSTARS